MEKHYAVPVETTTHQMNSGFAATSVRNGFTGNVSKSLQLEPSISSSTSALPAATTKDSALSLDHKYLGLYLLRRLSISFHPCSKYQGSSNL